MSKEILANITFHETRIARLDSGVLQEVYVERPFQKSVLRNLYKGRVSRVLPALQAAFIDIGFARPGFLHRNDFWQANKLETAEKKISIEDFLTPGQEIIVQILKDPMGSKGARLTTFYSIPSCYLALTPNSFTSAISRKIMDEAERERLLRLLLPGKHGGYIARTAANGVSEDYIKRDRIFLETIWQNILDKIKSAKVGECLYQDLDLPLRILRDFSCEGLEKIVVDDQVVFLNIREYLAQHFPLLLPNVFYYQEALPLFDAYEIEKTLRRALQRLVPLKSGAYIVFDQTEAMTTIDVNSGSFSAKWMPEKMALQTNLEAVDTIFQQVRLRNLGGMIIIDFIDMNDDAHKITLIEALTAAFAADSAHTEFSGVTRLGLVQMTRKRTRESLSGYLCVPCPMCNERGVIKSVATTAYDMLRALQRFANHCPNEKQLRMLASQKVVQFLLDTESEMLTKLQESLGKKITLEADSRYQQADFDILPGE